LEPFWEVLTRAPERALLLDYDGTLAPFRVERDEAFPYPEVPVALQTIRKLGTTRVVVISGRTPEAVVRLLGLDPPPEVWGSHGLEHRLPDGRVERAEIGRAAAEGLDRGEDWARREGLEDRLEQKYGCLALHWRGMDPGDVPSLKERVQGCWAEIGQRAELEVRSFDGGVELRSPGPDKGHAVRAVVSQMGERTVAAYLGDDLTDEDAFRAIRTLGRRGVGILVRSQWRATVATIWLRPPTELFAFLSRWAEECG
jgi:trehalose-phosphatase